jgi:hypothetical protein
MTGISGGVFARCLGEGLSLKMLTENKNVFIARVKSSYGSGSDKIFKTEIVKALKGKMTGEVLIIAEKFWLEDGDPGFHLGSVYLLVPYEENGKFYMSACSYFVKAGEQNFSRDSICFSAFSNPDAFIDVGYYKGQLKNGKPSGVWIDYGDSGVYRKGKRHGQWNVYGEKYIYKKGKVVYWEEKYTNDSLIKYSRKVTTMVYRGKIISIWREYYSQEKVTKFDKGKKVQEIIFKSENIVEIKCYKDGVLYSDSKYKPRNEKLQYPIEDSFDAEHYFYWKNYHCPDTKSK